MRSVGAVALAVLLVVLAPAASAGFTPASDVRNYLTHVFEGNTEANGGEVNGSFTFAVPHDFEVLERSSWFRLDISYVVEGGVVARETEFTFQSDRGHECMWRVAIGAQFEALNVYRHVTCTDGPVVPGPVAWWINATTITGTNPVQWSEYSITLEQREEVDMSTDFEALTGLTGVEFLALLGIAAALLMVGTTTQHRPARMVAATLAVVLAVLLLFFHASGVVVVLATAIGLGAGVIFLLAALERVREGRKAGAPRRFFD